MLGDFQKKKLTKLFHMYDKDKNGKLEEADFIRLHQKRCTLRGWLPGSAEYDKFRKTHVAYWNHIRKFADRNGDDHVTLDEWLRAWGELAGGKLVSLKVLPADIQDQIAFAFDALDLDGDGKAGPEDYRLFLKAMDSSDEAHAADIFKVLDLNGDGHVSKDEAMQLSAEFFLGDDPKLAGNQLYGRL